MIHPVSGDNLHRFGPQLDQMFALRRSGVIRPASTIDAADPDDDEHAIYLMDVDDLGMIWGAVRLHPGDVDAPCWRCGRWVERIQPGAARDSTLARLTLGLLEFCGSRSQTWIIVEAEAGLLSRLAALGCRLASAGDGKPVLDVGPTALEAIRKQAGIDNPLLANTSSGRLAGRR